MHTPDDLRYHLALIGTHAKFQSVVSRNIISDIYSENEPYGEAELLTEFFNDLYSSLKERPDSDFVTEMPY